MSCIDEISIQDYARRLIKHPQGKRIPLSGTLELTFRCNNRCLHCYVNQPAHHEKAREKELSSTEIHRFLDDMAQEGTLWLLLTGGEPLLRPDFEDIYLYAKKKGFLITLFTNGTLITPSLVDFLKEFPPRFVEITLYGATEGTYEKVTRMPGSYQRCRRGIDLLQEGEIPLKLKTVVMNQNKDEFILTKQFVEGLGLEFRFDALLNGNLDGSKDMRRLRISPQQVVELDLGDPQRCQTFRRLYERAKGEEPDREHLFRCGAGLWNFHIDPYGQLSLCNMARTPSYDLRHGTFAEGWHEFFPRVRELRAVRDNPCMECRLVHMCDQCPGWSQLERNDPGMPVDYLCRITHLRAKALGMGPYSLEERCICSPDGESTGWKAQGQGLNP
ncbi:MAG: radical SAM protein [Deltaproteobacteria bacterium]|jgi:radical SAM protein with 4Fe4S-binding SPASM domain